MNLENIIFKSFYFEDSPSENLINSLLENRLYYEGRILKPWYENQTFKKSVFSIAYYEEKPIAMTAIDINTRDWTPFIESSIKIERKTFVFCGVGMAYTKRPFRKKNISSILLHNLEKCFLANLGSNRNFMVALDPHLFPIAIKNFSKINLLKINYSKLWYPGQRQENIKKKVYNNKFYYE